MSGFADSRSRQFTPQINSWVPLPKIFMETMTTDGEGYNLLVAVIEDMDKLALPYTDDFARERRKNVKYPHQLEIVRQTMKM